MADKKHIKVIIDGENKVVYFDEKFNNESREHYYDIAINLLSIIDGISKYTWRFKDKDLNSMLDLVTDVTPEKKKPVKKPSREQAYLNIIHDFITSTQKRLNKIKEVLQEFEKEDEAK